MSLTRFLQGAFAGALPADWRCSSEAAVMPDHLRQQLGFTARADLLLENPRHEKRIWIEFEVSRADPAANHLKFAIGHLFAEGEGRDAFVSMVSNHVTRGRANLGASAIVLMRHLGMKAVQIPLLPEADGAAIKALNHLSEDALRTENLDVTKEIERAFCIVEPAFSSHGRELFYAGNQFEVANNIRQWNRQMAVASGAALWRRRTITYLVYDPTSR